MPEFIINDIKLKADIFPEMTEENTMAINSVPRPYSVCWVDNYSSVMDIINNESNAVLLIDEYIKEKYFGNLKNNIPVFTVRALEKNKNIYQAIDFAEFMSSMKVHKGTMVYVVGGGIMQDIGAFACAMYKRGIPWTYVPTTLLGMLDSCIGGKSGLNHKDTKNLIALFSAPHQIVMDYNFLNTLPKRDKVAGLGESLRLHVTGGPDFFNCFRQGIDKALYGSINALELLTLSSLSVKRAVVEYDEFEINLRRSMNYGHSIGHAFESLTNFQFPHGMGISIGMIIENLIAVKLFGLARETANEINQLCCKLIDNEAITSIKKMNIKGLNDVLQKDKKVIGDKLFLAVPIKLGEMSFCAIELNDKLIQLVQEAVEEFLGLFQ